MHMHTEAESLDEVPQEAVNLLICTVQVRSGVREHGKRWCFDVVSPYRSYTLQAESEEAFHAWTAALRAAIEDRFYSMESVDDVLAAEIEMVPRAPMRSRRSSAHPPGPAAAPAPSSP